MDLNSIILRSYYNSDKLHTPFQRFLKELELTFSQATHNLVDMRTFKSTKTRGDIFEEFCVLYLLKIKGYKNAWRLQDVPEELKEELSIKGRDVGIDIVAEDEWGKYSAVQCKFKADLKPVSWKSLSTFYSLCGRTGVEDYGWKYHIVMTNATFVRHKGNRQKKDRTHAFGTFNKLKGNDWLSLANDKGHSLTDKSEEEEKPKTLEEIREIRLRLFDK